MGSQPVLYAHRDTNTSFYLQDRIRVRCKIKYFMDFNYLRIFRLEKFTQPKQSEIDDQCYNKYLQHNENIEYLHRIGTKL